jgi:amidohydrolase
MSREQQLLDIALTSLIDRVAPDLVATRRLIHAHPELAFQETHTAALVAERCDSLGLRVRTGVGGTGVTADLEAAQPGSTVLVRADMDALPIHEGRTGRAYRSRNVGVMHACGHDGHVAIALGVAHILSELRSRWKGRVRFLFQPAEEIDEGAERVIADGALNGVDFALGLHLMATLPTGTVDMGSGAQWFGSDLMTVTFHGSGGHAGDPRGLSDPVSAAAEFVLALDQVSSTAGGDDQVVVRVAQVQAGTAHNVLPEIVALTGTLRALNPKSREELLLRVRRAARRAANRHGVRVRPLFSHYCPPCVSDPQITAAVRRAIDGHIRGGHVTEGAPTSGSDDMAVILSRVDGAYFRVGAGGSDPRTMAPHHHKLFDFDESALTIGAEALTRAVLAALTVDRMQGDYLPGETPLVKGAKRP